MQTPSAIERQIVDALARAEVPTSEQVRLLTMLRHELRWFPPTARVQAEWNCYRQVVRLLGGRADA